MLVISKKEECKDVCACCFFVRHFSKSKNRRDIDGPFSPGMQNMPPAHAGPLQNQPPGHPMPHGPRPTRTLVNKVREKEITQHETFKDLNHEYVCMLDH